MDKETITISKEEYEALIDANDRLLALESAGVDNWQGFDFAMETYRELKKNE